MPLHQDRTSQSGTSQEHSVSTAGVDLTLIRKYLTMSPTERLQAWYSAARLALELQKHAPRPPDHS